MIYVLIFTISVYSIFFNRIIKDRKEYLEWYNSLYKKN